MCGWRAARAPATSASSPTTRCATPRAPALTVAGDLAVGLINGAVVVEAIFGWPGIGKLMIDAILQRDFAVLQAAVLLTALSASSCSTSSSTPATRCSTPASANRHRV